MKLFFTSLLFLTTIIINSQTPITDTNIHEAVNTCLSTHPETGLCTDSEYGSITEWDVSNVTIMSNLFLNKTQFNGDISSWDVSSVTNMRYMFNNASSFNGDLSSWDVGDVTDMYGMFLDASSFNQDLSGWCVSSFDSEPRFFSLNSSLSENNKPVWNTCPNLLITNNNIREAVNTCLSTNPVNGMCSESKYGSMPDWDVSRVTDMSNTFKDKTNFNGDISSWDVSSVINMNEMFKASSFNGDLSSWDVSNVTDMGEMFWNASSFNGDLSSWDVSNVINMSYMFVNARVFDGASWKGGDLSSWDVSSVTDMSNMFSNARSFNGDLSSWDVSSVTDMSYMFTNAVVFNRNINQWDVSSVINMDEMFKASAFNGDISNWDVSSVTNMYQMFYAAKSFNQDLSSWDVSSVTNMVGMFRTASSFNQDLSGWCVSNIDSEPSKFSVSSPLTENNKPDWGTCPITNNNFQTIINTCLSTNPEDGLCSGSDYGVMSDWDVSRVTDMSNTFKDKTTFNGDILSWDVSNVTTMSGMFNRASSFNQNLNYWDVSKVTDMNYMFSETSVFNQSLNYWDVSNVTDMSFMFYSASNFNQDLGSWDVSSVTDAGSMFDNSGLSTDNYDNILIEWSSQSLQSNVQFGAYGIYYCSGETARQNLIDNFVWVISDGGLDCSDTTVPVITLVGESTVTLEVGTTYTDEGASASDNYDGDITSNIVIVNNVDTSVVGTYTVTYNVSDSNGNEAEEVTRTVQIVDTTVPVITLEGESTVTLEVGTTYSDAGAIASDNYDGDITSNIVIVNNVDTSVVGTYTVTYNVSDSNGNEAEEVTRTVNVESSLSVDDNIKNILKIYPNPVDDKLIIQGLQKKTKVSIYTILGKLVLSEMVSTEIDVSNLKTGIYLIKVSDIEGQLVRRFMKK
jgi:surface protein